MTATFDDAEMNAVLAPAYAAARRLTEAQQAVVVLHIGAEHAGVGFGNGPQMAAVHVLPLGATRTAREHFPTTPPSGLAMENAIARVEDIVMPLRAALPQGGSLFTQDAGLAEIATLAGAENGNQLSLEAMERCFDQLAHVVMGAPAAHLRLPASADFAARLLILREFMHHLQFAHLQVLAP